METLAQRIERHEGRRAKVYRDSRGILSIGVGRNLNDGLRDDEINLMRDNDIQAASVVLLRALPWTGQLQPAVRREVLVEMVFNMGLEKLLDFKKMLAAAEIGAWSVAADEMLASAWRDQVGERADELATIMRTGQAAR